MSAIVKLYVPVKVKPGVDFIYLTIQITTTKPPKGTYRLLGKHTSFQFPA